MLSKKNLGSMLPHISTIWGQPSGQDTFLGNLESRSLAREKKKRKKYEKEQEVQEDPGAQAQLGGQEEYDEEEQEDQKDQEEQEEQEYQGQDLAGKLGARSKKTIACPDQM